MNDREHVRMTIGRILAAYRNTSETNAYLVDMAMEELRVTGAFKPPKAVLLHDSDAAAAGTPDALEFVWRDGTKHNTPPPSAVALDLAAYKRFLVCSDENDCDYEALYCTDCEEVIEDSMNEWRVRDVIKRCDQHNEVKHR